MIWVNIEEVVHFKCLLVCFSKVPILQINPVKNTQVLLIPVWPRVWETVWKPILWPVVIWKRESERFLAGVWGSGAVRRSFLLSFNFSSPLTSPHTLSSLTKVCLPISFPSPHFQPRLDLFRPDRLTWLLALVTGKYRNSFILWGPIKRGKILTPRIYYFSSSVTKKIWTDAAVFNHRWTGHTEVKQTPRALLRCFSVKRC